jgi:hypothetical protein
MLFPCYENAWADFESLRHGFLTSSGITVQVREGNAPLHDPVFSGTPTAPTPALLDSSTKIATTAWVNNKIDLILPSITEKVKIYYVLNSGQSSWSGQDYQTYNFSG